MKFVFGAAAALGVMMLVSCGGGGDGSPSAGPIATPAPPPPPPSPAYASARDFTNDRSGQGFASRIERFRPYGSPTPNWQDVAIETIDTLGTVFFTYRANPKSYIASFGAEQRTFSQITPYDQTNLIGDQDYRESDPLPLHRFFRLVERNPGNSNDRLAYVGFVGWSTFEAPFLLNGVQGEREVTRGHLYGQSTVSTDLPTSGRSTYDLGRFDFAVAEDVEFTIDWSTGVITGRGRLACPNGQNCSGNDPGEVTFSGTFDGSNRFRGTIAGSAGYTGKFAGSFYGPRAAEVGLVGELRHPTLRAEGFLDTGIKSSS